MEPTPKTFTAASTFSSPNSCMRWLIDYKPHQHPSSSRCDACDLGHKIQDGSLATDGIPSSIRFDRIEVSNIIDTNYVGLNNVLTSWSSLLCDNHTAAIIGYFMNWFIIQGDGCVSGAGESVNTKLMGSLWNKVKKVRLSLSWTGQFNSYFIMGAWSGIT